MPFKLISDDRINLGVLSNSHAELSLYRAVCIIDVRI